MKGSLELTYRDDSGQGITFRTGSSLSTCSMVYRKPAGNGGGGGGGGGLSEPMLTGSIEIPLSVLCVTVDLFQRLASVKHS